MRQIWLSHLSMRCAMPTVSMPPSLASLPDFTPPPLDVPTPPTLRRSAAVAAAAAAAAGRTRRHVHGARAGR